MQQQDALLWQVVCEDVDAVGRFLHVSVMFHDRIETWLFQDVSLRQLHKRMMLHSAASP